MELLNDLYVISLTHWDREWRFPFAQTRMLLVKMMDDLLKTVETDPDYKCFHLDGHTILLDDYCQVRPENAERLKKHIQAGRIMIGPWYALPEENQMSGESIVRNFLWGERLGRKYGGNMKVGYSPTSWGQVSQMPQIMRGCEIDSIIFYRGISADQVKGNYYKWQGADGTQIFSVRLGDYARASFFHLVDRPVVFNRGRSDQAHDWSLGGKPFKICGTGSATAYHFCQPPMGWFPNRIPEAFHELEHIDLGKWETPFAMAFECDDSTGPFVLTPKIIAEANKLVTNGKKIIHSNLPQAIGEAMKFFEGKDNMLQVLTGEMRNHQRAGVWTDLLSEAQAERMPTKYANRRAEFSLQRKAEPLAVISWVLGEEYPQFALDQSWHLLLQNHAHDSIGGCGRDEVNDDVLHRFKQVEILSETVMEDSCRAIASRIDTSALSNDDILLAVFNTLPRQRSEVVRGEIDIAKNKGVKGFTLHELSGQEVPVQIVDKSDFLAVFNHPQELPLRARSDRWDFMFEAKDIPAMGYKVFRVAPAPGDMRHPGSMRTGPNTMENEHLKVTVNPNGSVDITNKADGRVLREQNMFEDRGEVGDYWLGMSPMRDQIVTSQGSHARIAVIENGKLAISIEAKLSVDLPVRSTQDSTGREKEMKTLNVTTVYRLVRGEPFLRIKTTIENNIEDHLFRALFPTDIKTDIAWAQTPFDVIQRKIPLPDTRDWRDPYSAVHPHQNFVDLTDGKVGVAILNRGLPQYEAVDDSRRTIALTLLRCNKAWNSARLAYYPDQTGPQLQGTHSFEYAVMPHAGDWEAANLHQVAECFNVPPVVGATGAGKGTLPTSMSFLQVQGAGLELNALKKGEWDNTVVVRISNPTSKPVKGSVKFFGAVEKVEQVNLLETKVEGTAAVKDGQFAVSVPSKKIQTFRLTIKAAK